MTNMFRWASGIDTSVDYDEAQARNRQALEVLARLGADPYV